MTLEIPSPANPPREEARIDRLLAWVAETGPIAVVIVVAAAIVTVIFIDRESLRPDFLIRALYIREGLELLPRGMGTLAGVAYQPIPGVGPLRALILYSAVGLTLLRPASVAAGKTLWAAAIALPLAAVLTDFALRGLGSVDDIALHHLTSIAIVTALWRTPALEVETVVRLAKVVLGAFLAASLAAIVVGLPGAMTPDPSSLLPGIDERYSGVFAHANNLGPAAVLYLLLERVRPSRPRVYLVMCALALLLLVLSQSKTSWVAAVLVGVILLAARWDSRRAVLTAAICAAIAIPVLAMIDVRPADVVESGPVPTGTLMGRAELWEIGIERWRERPIIGQGSEVFRDIAEEIDQGWAGRAHNAYVAALAEHGLIGLVAALAYVGTIARIGVLHAAATRNASLAIVALLLARTVTQTPLNRFEWEEITVLALLFAWERAAARGRVVHRYPAPRGSLFPPRRPEPDALPAGHDVSRLRVP